MDRSAGGYNPEPVVEVARHRGPQGFRSAAHSSGAPQNEQGASPFGLTPCLFGGARRDRTVDLYNAIVALSQLSYGPENRAGGREV